MACVVRVAVLCVARGIGHGTGHRAQGTAPGNVTHPTVTVQDSALDYRQFDKVEITGSSIVRNALTQALPVQVITRQDIQKKNLSSLTEVLQNLSMVFNGLGQYQVTSALQLRLGLINLTDRKPPLFFYTSTSAVWGVNSQNNNLMGRTLLLGGNYKFRVSAGYRPPCFCVVVILSILVTKNNFKWP